MNDYWFGQAFNCAVLVICGVVACWVYKLCVSNPIRLKGFQYRIFALRDRMIRMVADGTVLESDPDWKMVYAHVNLFAHATSVNRMKNGLRFVLALLSSGPPTLAQRKAFEKLAPYLKDFLRDYTETVLMICWRGSWRLRWAVRLGKRIAVVAMLLKRWRPRESRSYQEWHQSQEMMLHAA